MTAHKRAPAKKKKVIEFDKDGYIIIPPPPPKIEVVPTINDVFGSMKVRLETARLLENRAIWSEGASEAKKNLTPINDRLKILIGTEATQPLFMWNDTRVNYFSTDKQSVKVADLISALTDEGFQPDVLRRILKKCVKTKTINTLKVTPPKGDSDDEEEDQ
jgi:hypothetical protein